MNPESSESERTRTVLLVEDDESTRSFIQRFLERDGYEVVAVDAAEEGIVEAGDLVPDVLIADIHLPGLSGIELAAFMLAQDPALPVILMTGDPDEELARRAMACGPVQYLLKPFEWFEMEAAVGFAINQRETAGSVLPGTVPAPVPDRAWSPVNPELVTGGWDVPADAAAEWSDSESALGVEADTPSGALEWVEPAPESDALGWVESAPEFDAEAVPEAEPIEWGDPEPIPDVEAEPFEADVEWVDLEPIAEGGAGESEAPMTWIDLEPIPNAERAASEGVETTDPEPVLADATENASVADVDWLDHVDRASYAGPGHGDRVSGLVLALYAAMDEPGPLDAHDLGLAARIHEAGRLHVPDGDPVELAVRGSDVLAEAGFPSAVTETVRYMHERWDGTSGPDRLSGSRIPVGAQMLAVADALDHYSSAWIRSGLESGESVDRAMSLVTAQQNLAFSPIVVGAMLQAAAKIREICMKQRPPDASQPSLIPALAAAESVPFALFASD